MYKPEGVPDFAEQLPAYLNRELQRIGDETAQPIPQVGYALPELHSEPARPREGIIVFADGTDWDPGGGKGIYAYYNSTWNRLG